MKALFLFFFQVELSTLKRGQRYPGIGRPTSPEAARASDGLPASRHPWAPGVGRK